MFGSFYNRQQPFTNPTGAEYNVPFRDIAPGTNQVNISGDAGGSNQGDAFEAFRRLFLPYAQNQADLASSLSLGAMPPEVQRAGMRFGDQPPAAPPQYGAQDFENAAQGMFQGIEDTGLLNKYFRKIGLGRR
jgi:hypothetical protein